jgi:hypothetical protein
MLELHKVLCIIPNKISLSILHLMTDINLITIIKYNISE